MRSVLPAVVCLLVALTAPFHAQDRPNTIRRAARPVVGQYIVVLQPDVDPVSVGTESAAIYKGRLRRVYHAALRGFAINLPAPAAAALARDPRVLFVEEDSIVEATQLQTTPPWGLDRIDQRTLPLDSSYYYGTSPRQVTVHVIDSGVRTSHAEFGGRAFNGGDYVDDDRDGDPNDVANDDSDPTRPDGADCHGHGTHVAGTVAGMTYGVAKSAIIESHRVLGCDGSGTLSAVVAAIDDVTADPVRPAVANMSLGGGASSALDSAVRSSIAAGVTYVVAAGNSNVDASTNSPARVAEAITVGATGSNDARASFSNYGSLLDVFAPGVSVKSAYYSGDTATATMSGTSMASPHVAGIAAMYLERHPSSTPAQVRDAIVGAATAGVVTSAGTGSPNRLLYSGFLHAAAPSVTLTSPVGGETLYTGTPFTIQWQASDADGLASFDVLSSSDNGATFAPIAECTKLAGTARSCQWKSPGPVTTAGRIRVVAKDTTGSSAFAQSGAAFKIVAPTGVITVTSPNTAANWGRSSLQQITWTHNMGIGSSVRIEVSRDGGATFPEVIGTVKHTSATLGSFNWRVTGPNTAAAMVRVTWIEGSASDVSNVAFKIADPFITVPTPSSTATNWGYESYQRVSWTTNLGPLDTVAVTFSPDGVNFGTSLAASVKATALAATVTTPVLSAKTTSARVRVTWSNAPTGVTAVATNPIGFTVAPAFVIVKTPNGGETWTAGAAGSITWTTNLGKQEQVQITLSRDGGATYTVTLAAGTKDDGGHSVTVSSAWATSEAVVRVAWARKTNVSDVSNSAFAIR